MSSFNTFTKRHIIFTVVLILLLIIITGIMLFSDNFLVMLGYNLLEEEQPEEADYIVVLQGGIPDRIVHGVELFKEDYADQILMAESRSFNNYQLIEDRQLDLPTGAEINKEASLQLGMRDREITVIPGQVDSTREEARAITGYLKEKYFDNKNRKGTESADKELQNNKLILVTSKFHSHRAKLIFQDTLTQNNLNHVTVTSTPSPYDPYSPDSWWEDRSQFRNVLLEYMKLINFYTFQL